MRNDELLVTTFAGTRLRMELDRIPLWRGEHVAVRQLVDDFARYSYLPRLKDPSVLLEAIRNGLALMTWEQDSFAYADGYDDSAGRYRGLQSGPRGALADNDPGLVVHPQVARRQMDSETAPPATPTEGGGTTYVQEPSSGGEVRETPAPNPPAPPPRLSARRYHGSVKLDPTRVGRDASQVADEVIAHLAGTAWGGREADPRNQSQHTRRRAGTGRADGHREQPHPGVRRQWLRDRVARFASNQIKSTHW